MKGHGKAILTFYVTAVVFTWPLALHLRKSIPAGSEPPTVSLFQLFTAEWTKEVIETGRPYWEAPFFAPHAHTFAWSEPQLFSCLLIWILSRVTGVTAAYNIILLSYMAFTGFIGYLLALKLTTDWPAALFAGFWLTAGSYVMQQICVLHLMATPFPFACICFSVLFAEKPSPKRLTGAAAMYVLTWYTCAQFGLFLTILLPFILIPLVFPLKWNRESVRPMMWAAIGAVCSALAILPYLLTQRRYLSEMAFRRTLDDVKGNFQWLDLITPAKGHWLASRVFNVFEDPSHYSWNIGAVVLAVIGVASALGLFRRGSFLPHQKKLLYSLFILCAASLVLGFGPKWSVTVNGEKYGLYVLLYRLVPGLDGIRSPARLAAFLTFGAAVIAAPALGALRKRWQERKGTVTSIVFVLLFAEMWTMPVALTPTGGDLDKHIRASRWLETHEPGVPVLELPMSTGSRPVDLEPEVHAMRRALRHHHPVINGYSGHFPMSFEQLKFALASDPQGEGFRYMEAMRPGFILFHRRERASPHFDKVLQEARLEKAYEDEEDVVFRCRSVEDVSRERSDIPREAKFRAPVVENEVVGVPLPRKPDHAFLVLGRAVEPIQFRWNDASDRWISTDVEVKGSIIMDKGRERLLLEILRLAPGAGGAARLVAAEELGRLTARSHGAESGQISGSHQGQGVEK
jgi:hypothetical protein